MVYHRDNVARALLDLGAKENVPLSDLVSFRVGGPAACVLQPKGEAELCRALDVCRTEHIPVVLLGNGTNVLPSDEGFPGLILQMSGDDATPVFEGTVNRNDNDPEIAISPAKAGRYFAIVFKNSYHNSGYIDLWELVPYGYIPSEAE